MWGDIAIAFLLAFITAFMMTPYSIKLAKKVGEDKEPKLIIFANNLFVSDSQISMKSSTGTQSINAINFRSNSDILLNTVSYLVNREPAITIKKKTEYVTYTATQKEDLIIRSIIFVIPLIIIVIGIVIWQIRRRKR